MASQLTQRAGQRHRARATVSRCSRAHSGDWVASATAFRSRGGRFESTDGSWGTAGRCRSGCAAPRRLQSRHDPLINLAAAAASTSSSRQDVPPPRLANAGRGGRQRARATAAAARRPPPAWRAASAAALPGGRPSAAGARATGELSPRRASRSTFHSIRRAPSCGHPFRALAGEVRVGPTRRARRHGDRHSHRWSITRTTVRVASETAMPTSSSCAPPRLSDGARARRGPAAAVGGRRCAAARSGREPRSAGRLPSPPHVGGLCSGTGGVCRGTGSIRSRRGATPVGARQPNAHLPCRTSSHRGSAARADRPPTRERLREPIDVITMNHNGRRGGRMACARHSTSTALAPSFPIARQRRNRASPAAVRRHRVQPDVVVWGLECRATSQSPRWGGWFAYYVADYWRRIHDSTGTAGARWGCGRRVFLHP